MATPRSRRKKSLIKTTLRTLRRRGESCLTGNPEKPKNKINRPSGAKGRSGIGSAPSFAFLRAKHGTMQRSSIVPAATFRFNTKFDPTLLLSKKAGNVAELYQGVCAAPDASSYFHTHKFLQGKRGEWGRESFSRSLRTTAGVHFRFNPELVRDNDHPFLVANPSTSLVSQWRNDLGSRLDLNCLPIWRHNLLLQSRGVDCLVHSDAYDAGAKLVLATDSEDQKRLAVEEGRFLLQRVARLFHFSFDEFARRVVAQETFEPGAPVVVDDGNSAAGL